MQNQYVDRETGLHHNFFRYYEPDAGMQIASNVINGKDWNDIDYGSVALGAGIGAIAGPVLGKVGKLAIGKCRNAYGPFSKWYRRKPSYSRSGGFRTNNSIS